MAASTVVGQLPVGHGGLGTVHRTTRTILSGEWDRQRWKETGCLSDGSGHKNLYALLSNLAAPMKPADKSYTELKEVLRAHLKQKPLIIAKRFRFHHRNQGLDPHTVSPQRVRENEKTLSSVAWAIYSFGSHSHWSVGTESIHF